MVGGVKGPYRLPVLCSLITLWHLTLNDLYFLNLGYNVKSGMGRLLVNELDLYTVIDNN